MASLDVTQLLYDPTLTSKFNVVRRAETVGENGRVVINTSTFFNVVGVVAAGSNNDLDRGSDFDVAGRSLSIVTKFKIINAQEGFKPDLIFWKGSHYLVKRVDPYSHFGGGFYQVECESIAKVDLDILSASSLGNGGQLTFNEPASSGYLALGF